MKISRFDIIVVCIFIISLTTIGAVFIEKESILYIATNTENSGCLMAYGIRKKSSTCLTEKDLVVNKYVIFQNQKEKKVFFLGFSKSYLDDPHFYPSNHQHLYELDLHTGKQKIISSSDNFSHQEIFISPDKQNLFVWKREKESPITQWWMLNIAKNEWKKLNKEKRLADPHVSPDGKILLAADLMSNVGYIMLSLDRKKKR